MYHEDAIKEAAHRADKAAQDATAAYVDGTAVHEVSITGGLAVSLRTALNGQIGGLSWSAHILRSSRGVGGEETLIGADLLIHVKFDTQQMSYSKGVLIQAKRLEPNQLMDSAPYRELIEQCNKMLEITPAAFVFDYAVSGMRCAPASVIAASNNRNIYNQCV